LRQQASVIIEFVGPEKFNNFTGLRQQASEIIEFLMAQVVKQTSFKVQPVQQHKSRNLSPSEGRYSSVTAIRQFRLLRITG
jgi:hypothetical protein